MVLPEIFQTGNEELDAEAEEKAAESPICYVNVKKSVNGQWEAVPRKFTIDELATVEQLYLQLGAGSYELFARDERNARIVCRRKVVVGRLPGEKEPLAGPAVVQQSSVMASALTDGGSFEHKLLMFMMQQQQENARLMLQSQQAQAQQFQTMMMSMLTMNTNNSQQHIQSMQQLYQAFGASQNDMLAKTMQNASSQSPQEIFLKAVEMVNELRAGATEAQAEGSSETEVASLLDMVGKGVEVYSKVQGLTNGAGAVAGAVAAGES